MGTSIIEGEDLFPLSKYDRIKVGKFEHFRVAFDEGSSGYRPMPGLAAKLHGVAGRDSIQGSFGVWLQLRDLLECHAI